MFSVSSSKGVLTQCIKSSVHHLLSLEDVHYCHILVFMKFLDFQTRPCAELTSNGLQVPVLLKDYVWIRDRSHVEAMVKSLVHGGRDKLQVGTTRQLNSSITSPWKEVPWKLALTKPNASLFLPVIASSGLYHLPQSTCYSKGCIMSVSIPANSWVDIWEVR